MAWGGCIGNKWLERSSLRGRRNREGDGVFFSRLRRERMLERRATQNNNNNNNNNNNKSDDLPHCHWHWGLKGRGEGSLFAGIGCKK